MKLPERLKGIRRLKHMTQAQVASAINIKIRQYQRYEYGEQEPTSSVIIAIADCFNVSADYLLGRSDNPTYEPLRSDTDI